MPFLLNLLFTLFCCDILAIIYALSCGEQLSPKVHLWRKMTNMRSEWELNTAALPLRSPVFAESFTIFFHTETLQQSIILPSTAWNRLLAIHQMRRQPNLTKPTWKNIYPALLKRNNELICRFLVIQKIHKKIVPEIRCLPLLLSYLSSFYKLRKGSLLRNTLQGKGKTFALKKSFALFWQNLFF